MLEFEASCRRCGKVFAGDYRLMDVLRAMHRQHEEKCGGKTAAKQNGYYHGYDDY